MKKIILPGTILMLALAFTLAANGAMASAASSANPPLSCGHAPKLQVSVKPGDFGSGKLPTSVTIKITKKKGNNACHVWVRARALCSNPHPNWQHGWQTKALDTESKVICSNNDLVGGQGYQWLDGKHWVSLTHS